MVDKIKTFMFQIISGLLALIFFYYKGKKKGQQEERIKTQNETIKKIKNKNEIALSISNTDINKLHYRDK